ncbi:NAD-dependent epimerase/dehydratase family protein [Amycolatopsis jejuensis]|uniref:NAD-dependent epimerase/dehydratase family protein n=1 Tax=Amycolatopsis jejuensis TaxID=330084 RepID=UPI00068A11E3|nr:NAD-dependent epimerase/dehydratase family protein [Amycolatopsis jejuensis]
MTRAMVIGATGYVGSRLAQTFLGRGYQVAGLARSEQSAAVLRSRGIEPVPGDLTDPGALGALLQPYDVIAFSAMMPFVAEHETVGAILSALGSATRTFVFMSGTGVVSVPATEGQWNEDAFAEDDPYPYDPLPNRGERLPTEQLVRAAADGGLRTFVVRPPLIWGHAGSVQVPQFFNSVLRTGEACYLGAGLNLYSNAHVDDVAEVAALAVERGTPGALYHVVSGEANFRTIAEAVARVTNTRTRSVDYQTALEIWGERWVSIGLAVNSRTRAPRTRADLGWMPAYPDLVDEIVNGSYAELWATEPRSFHREAKPTLTSSTGGTR